MMRTISSMARMGDWLAGLIVELTSGVNLTFATDPAARSGRECRIHSTSNLYLLVVLQF
jgi:hypothetical protein